MSITFFVKNKKKFLVGLAPVMSVDEALRLGPNLSQFNADEDDEEFDADSFYGAKLDEFDCLVAGTGLSGRGFEIGYEDGAYNVRIGTPSTRTDWKIALEYLKNLAIKMDGEIVSEDGEKFSAQNIESFNYEHDIRAGLEAIEQNLQKEAQISTIYGIRNEVSFDKKIMARILGAKDPADEFGKLVTDIQNLDAYFANQMFYRRNDNGEIIGQYVLSQDVVTALPYEPSVEYKNLQMLGDEKVARWSVAIFGGEGDDEEKYEILATLKYENFIQNLPKEKYKFIDAKNIVVSAFSKAESDELIAKCGKEGLAD